MKSYQVEDIKTFMNELLVNEKYDSFYMFETRLKVSMDYYINGKLNKDFFDSHEETQEYVSWRDIKHTIFELIKGKRLPISFKLILMFNRENIERLVEMNNLPVNPQDVGALFLNMYYENGELTVTTGTSLKVFTLDKTLEHLWDETVEKYYI
ncbi:MAG: hypothetical protein E7259_05745 [Lachnospiraceae bacterium]|nr:hypothetical protein [Lachnospiraceae bacterium]